MKRLFTDTDAFFEEQTRTGRLRTPTLVIILVGVFYMLQPIAIFLAVEDAIRINSALTVQAVFDFLEPLFLWFIVTLVFYVLLRIFTSRIQLGRVFRLSGWGFVPLALSGIVWSIGYYLAFRGVDVPDVVQQGVLESERNGFQQMMETATADPTLLGAIVVGSAFVLVSGHLWSYAILYSTDVEKRQAQIVAFVTAVGYAAWTVYQFL